MQEKILLKDVSAVAASRTVVIKPPIGPRYHQISIAHGYASGTNTIAAAMTNISEIRVIVNEKPRWTLSGTQLRDQVLLNGTDYEFQGVPNTAPGGILKLNFSEFWRRDTNDFDSGAWPSAFFNSFRIEIDLSTASTPTIEGHAFVDDKTPKGFSLENYLFGKVERWTLNASGTEFDYVLPMRPDMLQQLSLYPDSGGSNVATFVQLKQNRRFIYEKISRTHLVSDWLHKKMFPAATGRTASITDIVLDHSDLRGDGLPLAGAGEGVLTVYAGSAMSGTITGIATLLGRFD